MSIQSEINRIKNEVDSQSDIISQITRALDGKTAGNGSGGSASIETCTIEVTLVDVMELYYYSYTCLSDDGTIAVRYVSELDGTSSLRIDNVVCGSYFRIEWNGFSMSMICSDGVQALGGDLYDFAAPSTSGTYSIELYGLYNP